MYPSDQIRPQRCMNGTMPRNPAQALEPLCPDTHVEMRGLALAKAAMPPVALAVVHHLQLAGRERRLQPFFNLLAFRHFLPKPPSISDHKV